MNRTTITKRSTGVMAAVALAIGLVGASLTACDLTSPNHFQTDSTRGADSTDRQASLDAAELEAYEGKVPGVRLASRLSGPRG